MQAGVHIGERPKQIAALQRKPAACLFHEGTPAPSSGLHGGDISFRLHSSYVFTLRHRSAPGFIPGEKPAVSLVFPTEIEHYSCFRLYSGLRKKFLRELLFLRESTVNEAFWIRLTSSVRYPASVIFNCCKACGSLRQLRNTQIFRLPYLFRAGAAAGGTGAFPPENGAKFRSDCSKARSPHLKQPSGQQENRGSNKPRQTAKPQRNLN